MFLEFLYCCLVLSLVYLVAGLFIAWKCDLDNVSKVHEIIIDSLTNNDRQYVYTYPPFNVMIRGVTYDVNFDRKGWLTAYKNYGTFEV